MQRRREAGDRGFGVYAQDYRDLGAEAIDGELEQIALAVAAAGIARAGLQVAGSRPGQGPDIAAVNARLAILGALRPQHARGTRRRAENGHDFGAGFRRRDRAQAARVGVRERNAQGHGVVGKMDADHRQAEAGDLLGADRFDAADAVAWIDHEIARGERGRGFGGVGGRAERRIGHGGGNRGSACHFWFT